MRTQRTLRSRWGGLIAFLRAEDLGVSRDAATPTRTIIGGIIGLLSPHRRLLWGIGVLAALNAALAMVAPVLTRVLFDDVLFHKRGVNVVLLVAILLAMSGSILLGSACQLVLTYFNNRVGQQVLHDLRQRLYDRITCQSLRFFSGARTGELQTRVLGDAGSIQPIVTQTWGLAVENMLCAAAGGIAMLLMSWPLALVSLAMLLPVPFVSRHTSRVRRKIAEGARSTSIEMNVIAQQTLSVSGALLTKAFGRQSTQLARFRQQSARLSDLSLRGEVLDQLLSLAMQTFTRFAPFALYLVAGILLSSGHVISVGTLVAFIALQARLLGSLQTLAYTGIQITASMVFFERIFEYLGVEPEIRDRPGALELEPSEVRGEVTFDGVWFSYGSTGSPEWASSALTRRRRYWALRDLSLEIKPGQRVAIVGASGAGKTSLSYLIARLHEVTRGAVRIDGRDVRDIRLSSLAGAIGLVTQETYVLHASVRENLLYARPDADRAQMESAARAAVLHERIIELEGGYDTLLGDRGYRLSGGERQRLALARVFLKDPPILILDEATSSLDSRNERLIQEALARLAAGRTTVVIAHRLSTIVASDVIFVLHEGRLVEAGTHTDLLVRGGHYAELFAWQSKDPALPALPADGPFVADFPAAGAVG